MMRSVVFFTVLIPFFFSCDKQFLEVKRESNQVIPAKIEDLEALLDAPSIYSGLPTELGTIGSDEYYFFGEQLNVLSDPFQRNGYVWAEHIYEGLPVEDWEGAYRRVLYCNLVLEGLDKLKESGEREKNVRGMALFHRAHNFFLLQQTFGADYAVRKELGRLGIPLRLESDITMPVARSTVEEVYMQIVTDLKLASDLLVDIPAVKFRPGKQAAYSLLSKAYLQMSEYEKALEYAEKSLLIKDELIDFNNIDSDSPLPFSAKPDENAEIIYYGSMMPSLILMFFYGIDEELYSLYGDKDLRKSVYFLEQSDGRKLFKGSYIGHGSGVNFVGIAADEIILIKAECLARMQKYAGAKEAIQKLLMNRYEKGSHISIPESQGLLSFILQERRKELVFRGTRWGDLKRLNNEVEFSKELVRNVAGIQYVLSPNSPRYLWPLPDNTIDISRVEQNPR